MVNYQNNRRDKSQGRDRYYSAAYLLWPGGIRSRYGDRRDEGSGNHGWRHSYGNIQDQEPHTQERDMRKYGRPDNYPSLNGKRWDQFNDRRMRNEAWERRGYNYNRALEPTGIYRRMLPRNYKRSDQRILEDINDRLAEDPFVDASEIEVMLDQYEVTLTGTVDDRITKRRVEDIIEFIPGIRNVENKLRTRHRLSE